ncbi:putative Retrotransposon hot spot protein [Trypanosoma vivax]|uniref:Uncharacterized protein n=1 Tax=Trypanosoma vivax (strain Y486) TaxID=1055687 RepID=F9WNN6_TRYVY|nr:putative Retrotransposon hot spot protein [Trypanosoma vivax]CCD19156.1 hypothetical protein TvY486_0001780 [Trypanosoma vivax Y486]|eukprot:CCD19156.1 hypothetical protein TvY486_0001780 [Trypanosoma vivax Y486]
MQRGTRLKASMRDHPFRPLARPKRAVAVSRFARVWPQCVLSRVLPARCVVLCLSTVKVVRVWHAVQHDLARWIGDSSAFDTRLGVLIGAPGVSKLFGVGSYVLHRSVKRSVSYADGVTRLIIRGDVLCCIKVRASVCIPALTRAEFAS